MLNGVSPSSTPQGPTSGGLCRSPKQNLLGHVNKVGLAILAESTYLLPRAFSVPSQPHNQPPTIKLTPILDHLGSLSCELWTAHGILKHCRIRNHLPTSLDESLPITGLSEKRILPSAFSAMQFETLPSSWMVDVYPHILWVKMHHHIAVHLPGQVPDIRCTRMSIGDPGGQSPSENVTQNVKGCVGVQHLSRLSKDRLIDSQQLRRSGRVCSKGAVLRNQASAVLAVWDLEQYLPPTKGEAIHLEPNLQR